MQTIRTIFTKSGYIGQGNPAKEKAENARACIDRFEFPDIPCAYPVVWVRAREAAEICAAMGKRICDAHEWEGACAGSLEPPDYRFDLSRGVSPDEVIRRMRAAHNHLGKLNVSFSIFKGKWADWQALPKHPGK